MPCHGGLQFIVWRRFCMINKQVFLMNFGHLEYKLYGLFKWMNIEWILYYTCLQYLYTHAVCIYSMFLCVCMIFMRLSSRGKSIVYLYVKCSGRFLLKKQNKKNPPSIDLQSNATVSKKKGKALSTVGFAVLKRATDHHLCTALLSSMIFFFCFFLRPVLLS